VLPRLVESCAHERSHAQMTSDLVARSSLSLRAFAGAALTLEVNELRMKQHSD
jgi:hypothetical protein